MVPELPVAAVGWSNKTDSKEAGKEAAEAAVEWLAGRRAQLALVFGSSWFDQILLLQGIRSVLGALPLAGETTAGEIIRAGPVSHSCVVVLLSSDGIACSVGVGENADRTPREAGQQAAYAALREFQGKSRAGLLMFGDGLVTTYADVVRGLQEVLGTSFLIAGGMGGDDLRFVHTYQYFRDRVVSRAVVGVLLGGAIKMGVGIEHGFSPIGKPRRITQAHGNVLVTLDDQPAASVYEEYFGPELVQRMRDAEGLTRQGIAYPLGVQYESTSQWLLRNVVSFGKDGSLSCTGEMLEDGWLQLMIGSRELALEAAHKAALQAIRPLNKVSCVLVFDSIVRRKLLGAQQAALEIVRIREAVGLSVPLAGCYTYGEQAPGPVQEQPGLSQMATQTGSVLVIALGL